MIQKLPGDSNRDDFQFLIGIHKLEFLIVRRVF